ncbi:MAG: SH3 domain-containing protein [Gemmatimonadota bacterium]|jgi:hypothetical protein
MRSIRVFTGGCAVTLAACAQTAGPSELPAPPADAVVRVDTVRIETESAVNTELQDRAARLQIELLERDVLIEDLRNQLEDTRLELVRNLARLQTQATRAEAASGMAEAEIALSTLRRAAGSEGLPALERAEELFDQSSTQFEDANYGGALYLATQVRNTVRAGQERLGDGSLLEGESLFAVPVPLKTTSRSNVRSGPGLDFDVVYTADASTALTGQSRTSQWVRVVDEQGRRGWIFHTLVTSP